jgi:hypothetical protein
MSCKIISEFKDFLKAKKDEFNIGEEDIIQVGEPDNFYQLLKFSNLSLNPYELAVL